MCYILQAHYASPIFEIFPKLKCDIRQIFCTFKESFLPKSIKFIKKIILTHNSVASKSLSNFSSYRKESSKIDNRWTESLIDERNQSVKMSINQILLTTLYNCSRVMWFWKFFTMCFAFELGILHLMTSDWNCTSNSGMDWKN